MIGSCRKRDVVYDRLRADGVAESLLARVHAPIGLEIGAETPEEIAVSILAEIIAVRAGRRTSASLPNSGPNDDLQQEAAPALSASNPSAASSPPPLLTPSSTCEHA